MARVVRERGISTPVQNVACPSPASCSDREPPAFALHRSREQRCRNSPRPGRTSLMGCQPLLHKLRSQSETQEVHRKTRNASQKRTHTQRTTQTIGGHTCKTTEKGAKRAAKRWPMSATWGVGWPLRSAREARRETVATVCGGDIGVGVSVRGAQRAGKRWPLFAMVI